MKGRAYRVVNPHAPDAPFVVSGGILLIEDGWRGLELRSSLVTARYTHEEAQRALLVGSTDVLRNKLRKAGRKELADHLKAVAVLDLRELTEKP
jgi:hypothetical protein